jgi:hypothetical protein
MFLIGATACALALVQWLGAGITILLAVFPFCVLVERLFGGTPPTSHAEPSFSGSAANLVILILGATVCTFASWCGSSVGYPTIFSPLPLFVIAPLFLAGDLWNPVPWWFVAPIPFATFLFMNLYQVRVASPAPLPMRFPVLLGMATAFSILWFAEGWGYGTRYQGAAYTLASASINVLFLHILWGWWLAIRRSASKAGALGFATLLHCWLFWFAFPYLGELP